jgi:hypothetical protein
MHKGILAVCVSVLIVSGTVVAQGANISIAIQLHRDTESDGSLTYYAMPSAGYDASVSTLDVVSPTGWYKFNNGGGSSFNSSDPNTVLTNVKGDWCVTVDKGLGTERDYTFNVNADAVNPAIWLPAIVVTSITHNQALALPPAAIAFNNPGIFDWGYSNLYGPAGYPGNNAHVAGDAVSLVPGNPINLPGDYNFNIQFYTNAAPDVVFGDAALTGTAPGETPDDVFTFNAIYASIGYRSFSVVDVPEPASMTLLTVGALGAFGFIRRKKMN